MIEIKEKATVVITEDFLNQVKFINNKISSIEWSGILFYAIEGVPSKLSTFKIIPYYIHLMDQGDVSYTEFDSDESIIQLYDKKQELDPFNNTIYRTGKHHSHNNMAVFHSSTDIEDLKDKINIYEEYYFSLISNNDLEFDAKLAFQAELPSQKIHPKKFKGAKWQLPKKEVMVVINFKIEMPKTHITIPKTLKDRVDYIVSKPKTYTPNFNTYTAKNIDSFDMQLEYRKKQGKIFLRDFLHGEFNGNVVITETIDYFNALSFVEANKIILNFVEKFKLATPWQKENFMLYAEDAEMEGIGDNVEELLETIWKEA